MLSEIYYFNKLLSESQNIQKINTKNYIMNVIQNLKIDNIKILIDILINEIIEFI